MVKCSVQRLRADQTSPTWKVWFSGPLYLAFFWASTHGEQETKPDEEEMTPYEMGDFVSSQAYYEGLD